MKALILNNTVVDIAEVSFETHASLTWMDCPATCKAGFVLVGNSLVEAPEPLGREQTYSEKRATEYAKLNQWELQFDDQRDGTSTWVDAINAIKNRNPK